MLKDRIIRYLRNYLDTVEEQEKAQEKIQLKKDIELLEMIDKQERPERMESRPRYGYED